MMSGAPPEVCLCRLLTAEAGASLGLERTSWEARKRSLIASCSFLSPLFRLGKADIPQWKMLRPQWSCTSWLKLNGNSTWSRIPLKTSANGDTGDVGRQKQLHPQESRAVGQWTAPPAPHLWKLGFLGRGRLHPRLNIHWNFTSGVLLRVWLTVPWKEDASMSEPSPRLFTS